MRIIYALLIIVNALWCQSQTSALHKSDEEQIREKISTFSANLMAGNLEAVVKAYTEDGKIMPSRTRILEGEELSEYWNPKEKSSWITTYHKITPQEIKIWGDEAYDYGYYEGTSKNGDKVSNWKGKYVIIWRKVNGDWKIYVDMKITM